MKIYLILSIFLIYVNFSNGQLMSLGYNNNCQFEPKEFYRGYPHLIYYADTLTKVLLQSDSNTVIDSYPIRKNGFSLLTKNSDSVALHFTPFVLFEERKDTLFGEKISYKIPVIPFPKSEITIGKIRNGGEMDFNNLELSITYPPNFPNCISAKFIILKWLLQLEGESKTIQGANNYFTEEALSYLKSLPSGTKFILSTMSAGNQIHKSSFYIK